eukprot:4960584-Pleurochrysis_carterae.AAC.2
MSFLSFIRRLKPLASIGCESTEHETKVRQSFSIQHPTTSTTTITTNRLLSPDTFAGNVVVGSMRMARGMCKQGTGVSL